MTRAAVFLLSTTLGILPAQDGSTAVAAPASPPVSDELRVTVTAPVVVDFGTDFELVIERSWPRSHRPQPFDPLRLLPLSTAELETRVTPAGDRLVELRRYRAAMWRVGDFELGPFELRTKDADGQQWRSGSAPTPLTVRSVLPEPAGPIEWPGDVRDRARAATWPWMVGLGLVAVTVGIGYRRWRRTRPMPVPEGPPDPSPAELALAEIAALGVPGRGADAANVEAFYFDLAAIVRRFATRAYGIDAIVHTTPELVAVVPRGGDPLHECLFACDLVKFAAERPGMVGHAAAREDARAFVSAGTPVGVPRDLKVGTVGQSR